MWNELKDCIPKDHSDQVSSKYYVDLIMKSENPPNVVLDLGCGVGNSVDLFRKYKTDVEWVGVDISTSPEVNNRKRTDAKFLTYDVVNIPLEDNSIDLVYSNQVFEHVRYPELLLKEIHRILTNDGVFIGSVSYLEPYHSYSYWNYTPYGWLHITRDAGLKLVEIRPGIDGLSLIRRSYENKQKTHNHWFIESPINKKIDKWAKKKKKSIQLTNFRKLMYCGHFVFYSKRKTYTRPKTIK